MTNPCKSCSERTPGCHTRCPYYAEWEQVKKEHKERIRAYIDRRRETMYVGIRRTSNGKWVYGEFIFLKKYHAFVEHEISPDRCFNCVKCSTHYPSMTDTCDIDKHEIKNVFMEDCPQFEQED